MPIDPGAFPCYFRWIIYSSFEPEQTMEAKFYCEAPTVTEWQVRLHFEETPIGYWIIFLSLIFDNRRDTRENIEADVIATNISLNGRPIVEKNIQGYKFSKENRYKYNIETSALIFAEISQNNLVVEIAISLAEDAIDELSLQKRLERNPEGIAFYESLRCLSEDMDKLFHNHLYYNVVLHSNENTFYYAHSYILSVRWNNLFRRHHFDTTANTVVKTNIANILLGDILQYMYSAKLKHGFTDCRNPSYMTELFQVIDWYNIYHLYKFFVKSDSFQLRESRKSVFSKCYEFRLHFVDEAPVNIGSLSLHAQEYSTMIGVKYENHELMLKIQVKNWNRTGAWLSYSLLSSANYRVCAQVRLEITKMVMSGEHERECVGSILAHRFKYFIDPKEYVESGPVLFLGCLETFGDFISIDNSGNIEQWFRFNISFTDGTSIEQLQGLKKETQERSTRLDVLSNHMYDLWSKEIHSDIRLGSRPLRGSNVWTQFFLHKAILATRIPRLFDNILANKPIFPEFAMIDLSDDVFSYVVDYLYTGKIINAPQNLLGKISDFANRWNLQNLSNLINFLLNDRSPLSFHCTR